MANYIIGQFNATDQKEFSRIALGTSHCGLNQPRKS